MLLQRLIKITLLLSVAVCSAQQQNGANYALQTVQYGETGQGSNDSGVNPLELGDQFIVGTPPPAYFSGCSMFVISPDNTQQWGCGIRADSTNVPGALKCSAMSSNANPTVPAPVAGWNNRNLTGCGAPVAAGKLWVQSFTASGTQEPGFSQPFSATTTCPGSTVSSDYSNSLSGPQYSMPGTYAGQQGTQTWCYSQYVTAVFATGRNGKNYNTPQGIPNGPWGQNGRSYGGSNVAMGWIDFNLGLSNGATPTTTTLGNSSIGSPCTWALTNNQNLTGDNSAALGTALSTVVVSGTAYSGSPSATAISLKYTTSASSPGGYYTCTLPSTYTLLSVCYDWKTDIPISDVSQEDDVKAIAGDGTDGFLISLLASGNSLWFGGEETNGATTTTSLDNVPVLPNTKYTVCIDKVTGGATNTARVYSASGVLQGTIHLASGTGSHPAGIILIGTTGNETETN